MEKNNIVQRLIKNEIHYYDQTYGIILDKLIPKLKTWVIIYGIIHLIFINLFTKYTQQIFDDGILFVLPPFINIIITLFPYKIFELIFFKTNRNNDINYILQYYPDIAKKLWLPDGNNGFAWIKFTNYEYIKQNEDEFIDEIIYNCDEAKSIQYYMFFGNIIIIFFGVICLLYWTSIIN
jgi:hypothetical protein